MSRKTITPPGDTRLRARLEQVQSRARSLRFWCRLALCWAVSGCAAVALALCQRKTGWNLSSAFPALVLASLAAAVVVATRRRDYPLDWRKLAARIEARFPELDGRLLTAVELPVAWPEKAGFLEQRVLEETVAHARRANWGSVLPDSWLRLARSAHWVALVLFLITLSGVRMPSGRSVLARLMGAEVTVTPGDTSLERGSTLVVLARFRGPLPADVSLVTSGIGAGRIPLVKSLADPLFGGAVTDVSSNCSYHIEYGGQRTREFHVSVFEYPRLERADAEVTYPDYTGLPAKRIENTRRVSAVEGSHLALALKLNKPVASARLVPADRKGQPLALTVLPGQAAAALKSLAVDSSRTYDLQLLDAEGRTNKVTAQFVFEALKNRPPELRLASPRGDLRPSPLQEISFEGTVWDDFGVQAFGLAYSVPGGETRSIQIGSAVPGQEKRSFKYLLALEDLGLQPDQLVSWFAWADDIGPDGQVRRTAGDMFFAEIRPFDEVFREAQGMEGQSEQSGEQSGQNQTAKLAELEKQIISATWKLRREHGGPLETNAAPVDRAPALPRRESSVRPPGSRRTALAVSLPEKVFVRAPTFFGQVSSASDQGQQNPGRAAGRRALPEATHTYEQDAGVVRDSQEQALDQTQSAAQRSQDPRTSALWQAAQRQMQEALARLAAASNSPATLSDALAAEQAAYQALLRLQEHEYQVARSRSRNQRGGSQNQQMQRQLEEMDLTQSENRYETQRQAQAPQTAQRREQLQVMNRLQELARRQQDLNDRLKELQAALQEARTEAERAELQRRLKRLEEEEQQMLADVDELRQRMDRPENQSQMAEERRQLDQTREDVQRAAQAASQGAASQALAAGTRAQRQLQDMRDQMRKENSSQFADDLREMRGEARELSRQQDEIVRNLQGDSADDHKSLAGGPDQQTTREQFARQKALMTNLVERATQISQQAETSEPLLSSQLYDTVRKFTQDNGRNLQELQEQLFNRRRVIPGILDVLKDASQPDSSKLMDLTSALAQSGLDQEATEAGKRAQSGINQFKRGMERAAESVLGDDTEALRLARQELEQVTEQLRREMEQPQDRTVGTNGIGSAELGGAAPGGTNASASARQPGTQDQHAESQRDQAGGQRADNQPKASSSRTGAESAQSRPGNQPSASNSQPQGQAQGQEGRTPGSATAASGDADSPRASSGNAADSDNGARRNGERAGARAGGDWANSASASAGGWEGGGGGNWNWDRLLDRGAWRFGGPLTGEDFVQWSDRLRDVEEMLDQRDLRNEVAAARERARLLRQQYKRDHTKPDWAVVRTQVMEPLAEVRARIAEELARRDSREALVPIDRDPVPNKYSELVRRYYEQLGKDK